MEVYVRGPEVSRVVIEPSDQRFVRDALNAAISLSDCDARLLEIRFSFSEAVLRQARLGVCADIIAKTIGSRHIVALWEEEARIGYDCIMQGLRILSRQPHTEIMAEKGYTNISYRQ